MQAVVDSPAPESRFHIVLPLSSLASRTIRRGHTMKAAGPALSLALALLPRIALADTRSPFNPATPQGSAIESLFWFVLIIAAIIFVGVEGAILYSSFAHRDRPGRTPAQFSGNRRLEIAWTVSPALLLVLVLYLTVRTMNQISDPGSQPLQIDVMAHQWWWEFDYLGEKVVTANELHVPVGQTVALRIESADVIHSFWVPELAGKVDANPGHPYTLVFTAEKPGTYLGQCSEFCGTGHAWMLIRVIAEPRAQFDQGGATASQRANRACSPGSADLHAAAVSELSHDRRDDGPRNRGTESDPHGKSRDDRSGRSDEYAREHGALARESAGSQTGISDAQLQFESGRGEGARRLYGELTLG
jgi:cytochrome c oxidase subunit II